MKSGHSDRASEEQLLRMEEALKETIPKFFVSAHDFSVSNLVTSMASFICSIFFALCAFFDCGLHKRNVVCNVYVDVSCYIKLVSKILPSGLFGTTIAS